MTDPVTIPDRTEMAAALRLCNEEREAHDLMPVADLGDIEGADFYVDAASLALEAACSPQLGRDRLVPLGAVVDALRDYGDPIVRQFLLDHFTEGEA